MRPRRETYSFASRMAWQPKMSVWSFRKDFHDSEVCIAFFEEKLVDEKQKDLIDLNGSSERNLQFWFSDGMAAQNERLDFKERL